MVTWKISDAMLIEKRKILIIIIQVRRVLHEENHKMLQHVVLAWINGLFFHFLFPEVFETCLCYCFPWRQTSVKSQAVVSDRIDLNPVVPTYRQGECLSFLLC